MRHGPRKETSVFVELDTRRDARHTVSLEWDRDGARRNLVVADNGSSSVIVFPVSGENAGDAFRHPFRYAR